MSKKDLKVIAITSLIIIVVMVLIVLLYMKKGIVYTIVSYLGVILLVVEIIVKLVNKNKRNKKSKKQEKPLTDEEKAKLDKVIDIIKENTKMTSYKINVQETTDADIYTSKFGGIPYWNKNMEYPTDSKGNKLPLLAQINFEKEGFQDDRLPKKGILQFFVATDIMNGMDYENLDKQKDWKVIYHEEIIKDISKEEIKALGIPTSTALDESKEEYYPFYNEYVLKFEKTNSYISYSRDDFEEIVLDVLKEQFNENIEPGVSLYDYLPREQYYYIVNNFNGYDHKLLGHPDFTQQDPRESEDLNYYDTLLLQIGSEDGIMWGDCGVANFFINEKDLANRDFSKILYTWDCY